VEMITPTSGSSRAKSNARFSSITVRGLNAFLRSGLLMVILAMPSPSAFSYKISSKGGPDGRRGCVQAGSSRDTEPCSCSYLLDLRRGVGGGVSEAEQEESCSRDEDDGSTSVEACCCWQEGEMCRAIVAILCNAASSLRSMATMQKPQQTNNRWQNCSSRSTVQFFDPHKSISPCTPTKQARNQSNDEIREDKVAE
jgi:hypothetical protein